MNKEYIPKDLPECILWFLHNYSREELDRYKNQPESDICLYHNTVGRNIRNNWGMWNESSPLHQFFKSIEIWHADDMSSIILTCLHRILNHKPCKLKEQIEKFKEYWKEININKGYIQLKVGK